MGVLSKFFLFFLIVFPIRYIYCCTNISTFRMVMFLQVHNDVLINNRVVQTDDILIEVIIINNPLMWKDDVITLLVLVYLSLL